MAFQTSMSRLLSAARARVTSALSEGAGAALTLPYSLVRGPGLAAPSGSRFSSVSLTPGSVNIPLEGFGHRSLDQYEEVISLMDPKMAPARVRARELLKKFNAIPESEDARRQQILHEFFGALGEDSHFHPPFYCECGCNIYGNRLLGNFGCVIVDEAPVVMGNNVAFGPGVHIYTALPPTESADRSLGQCRASPVRIGDEAWIGGKAIICPGVSIGDFAVIGAGSVVTHDIPSGWIASGSPAKLVRRLDEKPAAKPKGGQAATLTKK